MTYNTHERGDVGEAAVMSDLISRGVIVSIPFQNTSPYDMVAEIDGEMIKIQCKCMNTLETGSENSIKADLRRKNYTKNGGIRSDKYSVSEIDMFAFYAASIDHIFYTPLSEVEGQTQFAICLRDPDEMQPQYREQANLQRDYTFEKAASRIVKRD